MLYTDKAKEVAAKAVTEEADLVGKTISGAAKGSWGEVLIAFEGGSYALYEAFARYDGDVGLYLRGSAGDDELDLMQAAGLLTEKDVKAERKARWDDNRAAGELRERMQYLLSKLKYEQGMEKGVKVMPTELGEGTRCNPGTVTAITIEDAMSDEPTIKVRVGWPKGCGYSRTWPVELLQVVSE